MPFSHTPAQLPVSQLTGNLAPSFDFTGKHVNQELRITSEWSVMGEAETLDRMAVVYHGRRLEYFTEGGTLFLGNPTKPLYAENHVGPLNANLSIDCRNLHESSDANWLAAFSWKSPAHDRSDR